MFEGLKKPEMKNILVPVDFSEPSKVAARYALKLAEAYQYKIHLFCVRDLQVGPHALSRKYKLEKQVYRNTRQEGMAFVRELQSLSDSDIQIDFISKSGSPVHLVIEQYVKLNHIDFIIMGTHGASGMKKIMLGSNAADVINFSSVPVLVVPQKAEFKGIKSIVYASDLTRMEEEMNSIQAIVEDFDASIHIVHVDAAGNTQKPLQDMVMDRPVQTIPYASNHFHLFNSTPIAEAIDEYGVSQQTDLLVLFTHKLEFFEKLLDTSVTRQLVFHHQVPLLSFNKTNARHCV